VEALERTETMKLRLEMKEYDLYDEENHDVNSSESDSELQAVLSYSQSNQKGKHRRFLKL
jgi:hypothetical protein